jgi:PAS domain S-box-containing protein
VDPSLKVFAWNSEAVARWERKERQVVHRPLGELGLGGVDAEIVRAVERVVRTGKPASLTEVAFPSANETKHVRLRASAIVGPSGQVLGALLTAEDVTKQTEVQIDARLQSLFSESLVRSLPAALLVADSRDRIISWNRSAEEILGVDESDALGRDLFELDTPLSRGAFKKRFLKHKRTGDPSRVRVRLEAAGEPAQFVVTQCPFLGENDTVRGTILMLQEVYQNVEA